MDVWHRILLVDDDPICNFIHFTMLKRFGLELETVIKSDGREALDFITKVCEKNLRLPDLILLDAKMPIMDGFEFLEKFGKLPGEIRKETEVIMLSSLFSPSDIDYLNDKKVLYMLKPLSRKQLKTILDRRNIRT